MIPFRPQQQVITGKLRSLDYSGVVRVAVHAADQFWAGPSSIALIFIFHPMKYSTTETQKIAGM